MQGHDPMINPYHSVEVMADPIENKGEPIKCSLVLSRLSAGTSHRAAQCCPTAGRVNLVPATLHSPCLVHHPYQLLVAQGHY